MKKVLVVLIALIMILSSAVYAQDIPDNFLVIGDKIIDLTYAMENKKAFNEVLNEFLVQEGTVEELYVVIGRSFLDIYGIEKTESQKQDIISSCKILIDNANPNGVEIYNDDFEVISIY